MMPTLLLNYSHPLSTEQRAQLDAQLGQPYEVREIVGQADRARPLAEVVRELADAAQLSAEAWQTTPLVINPPALAPVALALLAELHGRCGGFPAMLNIRPVADSTPTRYEIAELVNLQSLRGLARTRREG